MKESYKREEHCSDQRKGSLLTYAVSRFVAENRPSKRSKRLNERNRDVATGGICLRRTTQHENSKLLVGL